MDKLNALRKLFLSNQHIKKHPENLGVYAGDGSIDGDNPTSFTHSYEAIIIITEYPEGALDIIYPLRQWYLINQPNMPSSNIKWDAELLSNEGVDLEIHLPLTEQIIVKKVEGGTELVSCDDIIPVEPEILQVYGPDDQLLEEKPAV